MVCEPAPVGRPCCGYARRRLPGTTQRVLAPPSGVVQGRASPASDADQTLAIICTDSRQCLATTFCGLARCCRPLARGSWHQPRRCRTSREMPPTPWSDVASFSGGICSLSRDAPRHLPGACRGLARGSQPSDLTLPGTGQMLRGPLETRTTMSPDPADAGAAGAAAQAVNRRVRPGRSLRHPP